ncbi:hypothetical protein [Moraxella atlantae]|uniref:Uncharacterized protein n=1 Tax=Faucicola atlantae TaxID=34059 RepID=A0A378Q3I7_9GAMM|nr:hypothetical protein [Moraxella atlantae]OPH35178.1 hypothetical protein B5J92_05875 [Moraxella atlantae]STY95076.1 Uncharacterised protein [Moraxella atlantae]
MLNTQSINTAITTLGFELELSDKATRINAINPHAVQNWVDDIKDEFKDALLSNQNAQQAIADIETLLAEQQTLTVGVSSAELKQVYEMLKNRQLHPAGEFDNAGRFYLEDYELVDVRAPSAKYPFSQMNAGRTSKFVKAMAEKYKVQTLDQLISLFRKAK